MITLDAGAFLRGALADATARDELARLVEAAAEAGARRALDERERDAFLDARGAAALVGRTPAAFKQYRRRHPEIDGISVGAGKSRRWRRSDLAAWMQRSGPRLVDSGTG